MTLDTQIARRSQFRWLPTGREALAAMIEAIDGAQKSVRLEMYIIRPDAAAERFRDALCAACRRGVEVRVLADAFGTFGLPEAFWKQFREDGGEFRWFNPLRATRFSVRDHRKLLVCDDEAAIVGGVNIASEYDGDGVSAGWRDLGLAVEGPLVSEMGAAFDEMFAEADLRHPPLARLRRSTRQRRIEGPEASLLLGAPGRANPILRVLCQDLKSAREARIICPYFLPPRPLWRALARLAKRGGRAVLILPGKSDFPLSRLAAHGYYRRLLKAGVEIHEYQPQILHTKLVLIDDIVYAGSANLDSRGLRLNYEILLRVRQPALAASGRELFESVLGQSRRVEGNAWNSARTAWDRFKGRLANFILARLDPIIAFRQLE